MAAKMALRTGIDIVHIPRVKSILTNKTAFEKIFTVSESSNLDADHLSGILAAKEAYFKAIGIAPRWLDIEILTDKTGKPSIIAKNKTTKHVLDVSISHDGDYAVAIVILDK